MKPISEPKGAAKEYCDWALNIYSGCPHACSYCYCPKVLHKDQAEFFTKVEPRKNIVEEVRKQLEREQINGRLIQLCFIGDPYPTGYDTTTTREIIKLLKEYGNHVQILTKGDGSRDFDLLDENDWYGVTLDGYEHAEVGIKRLDSLRYAKTAGANTWISFEPVIDAQKVFAYITLSKSFFVDRVKIGKLEKRRS